MIMNIEFGKEKHVMKMEKLKPIIAKIKKQKDIIAKARDELSDIEEKLCYEIDTFELAVENLQKTIDLLSEYV